MANFGIALELGVAAADRWWANCGQPADDLPMGVEAGAWHPSLHPEFEAIIPFCGERIPLPPAQGDRGERSATLDPLQVGALDEACCLCRSGARPPPRH